MFEAIVCICLAHIPEALPQRQEFGILSDPVALPPSLESTDDVRGTVAIRQNGLPRLGSAVRGGFQAHHHTAAEIG